MTTCDKCDAPASVRVYATYGIFTDGLDESASMYPMPMIRSCFDHLTEQLTKDQSSPGASDSYVLRVTAT